MPKWALQDAKARFSELLDTVEAMGPQVVTRRGVDAAVIVRFEDWQRMKPAPRDLKDVLLTTPRDFDLTNWLPKRTRRFRGRRLPTLD